MTDHFGDLADFLGRVRDVRQALRDMRNADNDLADACRAGDRPDVLDALKRSGQARDRMLAAMESAFPEAWQAARRYCPPDSGT